MFNGLIREMGIVAGFDGKSLEINSNLRPKIGESIAVNGACLSATRLLKTGFVVELSSESAANLALKNYNAGKRVHLEPAMVLGERIDGHLIQGHIDAVGEIYKINKLKSGTDFFIKIPGKIAHLVANKGSVAIDGVSLTINEVGVESGFDFMRLTIIPITLKETLFGEFGVGRMVNIETDLLARYTARMLGFVGGFSKMSVNFSGGVAGKNPAKSSNLSWEEAEFYAKIY